MTPDDARGEEYPRAGTPRGARLAIFLQLVLNGVAVGCIYGLVALGFVLIYKATELVNFSMPTSSPARPSSTMSTSSASGSPPSQGSRDVGYVEDPTSRSNTEMPRDSSGQAWCSR